MKPLNRLGFSVIVMLSGLSATAQQKPDSVTWLQEVTVEQSRLEPYAIGHYVLKVDSAALRLAAFGTAADLLRKNGFGHIRSYGIGGVTTPSFRGTGASHTSILWNGINLQSPLLGQSDFTHIPINFADDIQLQSGGTATLFGSGAIGGTIRLKNQPTFEKGLHVSLSSSAGSFNSYFQGGSVQWSGKNFIHSTRAFSSQAKNNFTYLNQNVNPTRRERREHASVLQYGLLQQNYWRIQRNQIVSVRLWYQNNDIEVPNPTTVNRVSQATQRDEFYRNQLGWELSRNHFNVSYQSSFIRHQLDYRDASTLLTSKSLFHSFVNNLEGEKIFNAKISTTAGANSTWEKGWVDEYGRNQPVRNRVAFFSAWKYCPTSKWISVISARQELTNGKSIPFVPSLSIEFHPASVLNVYANASRNYRIPTFNDLFWKGSGAAGNPNLKSELSWSEELGVNYEPVIRRHRLSIKAAAFSNLVDDWILWSPTSIGWSPENIKQVWSRGFESNLKASSHFGQVETQLTALYSFTRSTNRSVYDGSLTGERGKLLLFTPQHEGSLSAQFAWRKAFLNATYAYTGKQYTDGDNSEFFALPGNQVTSLWLSRDFTLQPVWVRVQFEVNNLFDVDYQARPGYPLPGRNFKIALTIQFNKPIKYEN